jgi:signal transduction histidine kinase/CheY-like chemotaxis protein
MKSVFKRIIEAVRSNGCKSADQGIPLSYIVYSNLIWLVSYTTFIIYTVINLFLIDSSTLFAGACIFFHVCYITVFVLIKKFHINFGRHLLLITTYFSVAVFDHLNGPGLYTYLFLFAFLPAALNIFHIKKQLGAICMYMLFPLLYVFISQFYSYAYFNSPILNVKEQVLFKVIILVIAFIHFVLFASYMILKSSFKQSRLVSQSLGLQTTLNNASGAIWSIDIDFNLTVTNESYIASIEKEFGIKGLNPGSNIKEAGLWQMLDADLQHQYFLVLAGEEILQEIKLNDKEFEIKGVPLYDKNGMIAGATFCSRDVTSRNNFEKILITAKKETEEASKAKEKFLSNMSHEIRTPLNGIIGIVDILRDEKYLPEQEENFENLKNLSQHTLQLVTNILDFAKIEAGKAFLDHKRFGLKQLINKINSVFINSTKLKGINFKITVIGCEDIYVKGDEIRLSQVLINLIGNAIKFTETGGVELEIKIDESCNSNYDIQFKVIDTGIGIKQENLKKIFEGFNQADEDTTRRFGGSGLGLSISEMILNLMGAKLIVKSEINKGSEFYFSISLEKSSILKSIKDTDVQNLDHVELPDIKILLAEDNNINQLVANKILTKWKAEVVIVENGQMAFEKFQDKQFDIILMDLDMPVMDGYESLSLIRKYDVHIPVIALTAASFDDMDNYLLKKGFNGVVQKPFVKSELYSKILQLVTNDIEIN